MGHRRVQGLRWARMLEGRPPSIPVGRPRGAKAAGVRYERAVAAQVQALHPGTLHGQWWEFQDLHGHGYCQTDLVVLCPGLLLVLECKYTWVEQARRQLDELYLPVVRKATGERALGVVVCKVLTRETQGQLIGGLQEAHLCPAPVWHNFAPPKRIASGAAALLASVAPAGASG